MIKQKRGFQYDFFFQNARAEVKSLYLFHKASIEVYLHTRLEDLEKVKEVVFDKISSVSHHCHSKSNSCPPYLESYYHLSTR